MKSNENGSGSANINEAFDKPAGGYGRIWESMYKGSMMGAGLEVFAVWPYVIANMRGHVEHGALVELNPQLLAFMIGCEARDVEKAIGKLCAEDENSRTPVEDGKRLVRLGQFLYRVVNGGRYLAIRKAEADRVKNREAVKRHRQKKTAPRGGTPIPGEVAALEHGVTVNEHREPERNFPGAGYGVGFVDGPMEPNEEPPAEEEVEGPGPEDAS